MKTRLAQVYKALDGDTSCDAFLVVNPSNIEYITGFPGHDVWVLITPSYAYIITDRRYSDDAATYFYRKKNVRVVVITAKKNRIALLHQLLKRHRRVRVGFESNSVTYSQYQALKKTLDDRTLVPHDFFIERLRLCKDSAEIAQIRIALACNERVFAAVKRAIPRCKTEQEVVSYAESTMRRYGGDGPAFDTIVACGKKSAVPHARSDETPLRENAIILIDMGVKQGGYCSDLTRTFFWGRMSSFYRDVYDKVLTAQEIAISLVRPGVQVATVDQAVRQYFKKNGCAGAFTHALGHGLGRDVHEMPAVSVKSTMCLKPGMVITIEPGLYYPGRGGVRIEDMVLVTKKGCECLSQYPKKMRNMQIQ